MTGIVRSGVIAGHAIVGWGLCGAVMGAGRAVFSLDTALAIHALAAPAVFAGVSASYFRWFGYTGPATTAAIFTGAAIALDGLLIAPLVEHSYAMFGSPIGTWIPFALIFASTYVAGSAMTRRTARSLHRVPVS